MLVLEFAALETLDAALLVELATLEAALLDDPLTETQLTLTSVILAEPTVPDPLLTVQVCPVGWVPTVTAYVLPVFSAVANVKDVVPAVTTLLIVPNFNVNPVAVSPLIAPPTVYVRAQATATSDTLAVPMVPDPLLTVH